MANLSRYLSQYAEAEANGIDTLPSSFAHVLVIPAYRETLESLQQTWQALEDVLIILVINSPDKHDPETRSLLTSIYVEWKLIKSFESCAFYESDSHKILVVDRCSKPLQDGVGEARKIGADIACKLIADGLIQRPIIFNSDADATLPANYFQGLPSELGVMLYRFQHDSFNSLPAALYELSLLWYAAGLKSAGSPYGFPTVGSTIAFSAESYATVRGFPKRPAGEDFYLLNKLRKVATISYSKADPIQLSARPSNRVPFGTGPAIHRLNQQTNPLTEFTFYHPNCFDSLDRFLSRLQNAQTGALETHFEDPLHLQYLIESGLGAQISKRSEASEKVYRKFLNDWFDGFRTLKFIHFLRDHGFPSVPLAEIWQSRLLEALPDVASAPTIPEIQRATDLLWGEILS